MNILVLGGGGYVGRVLLEHLRAHGHRLVVVDIFRFSACTEVAEIAEVRACDTRDLTVADFADFDAVVDLAAISNDPAGELNPSLTREINALARQRSAKLAKQAGVERHLLLSSCSVYGANDAIVDETAPLNPLTAYAWCNALAEDGVLALSGPDFCSTVFRLATVFGSSPSMRFDLVVNTMTLNAFEHGGLTITGGGGQFRPLVHVEDVARAVTAALDAPAARVNAEIFNIGSVNLTMREVAAAVVRGIARPIEVVVDTATIDHRNYRVATDKARDILKITPSHSIEDGAAAIFRGLTAGHLQRSPQSIRLNGYRELVNTLVA